MLLTFISYSLTYTSWTLFLLSYLGSISPHSTYHTIKRAKAHHIDILHSIRLEVYLLYMLTYSREFWESWNYQKVLNCVRSLKTGDERSIALGPKIIDHRRQRTSHNVCLRFCHCLSFKEFEQLECLNVDVVSIPIQVTVT